jgi:hypothetical protein
MPWAIECAKGNGESILLGINHAGLPELPNHAKGLSIMLFKTKRDAQRCIKQHYSYIKNRADLRSPPHNWRMPQPVKVKLEVQRV